MSKDMITVLVSARKNSKYLAKFLFGLVANTDDPLALEVLVMLNEHDDWNDELEWHFSMLPGWNIQFHREDMKLGRAGLHEYFNELYRHSSGAWIAYFCEDHFIGFKGWDSYVFSEIERRGLDAAEACCIVPKFDNCGAMNHILSRGYCEALGGIVGRHGWIDSYLNDVNAIVYGREHPNFLRLDEETFHDFTHDDPSPMSDLHLQSQISDDGKRLPKYDSEQVRSLVQIDGKKLKGLLAGKEQ